MKKIIFLLLLFFAQGAGLDRLAGAAGVDSATTNATEKQPEGSSEVAQKMEGFNLVGYNESGSKSWDINGDKADVKGDEVAVTNVDANSYGDDDMNLKAQKGMINKTTGDVKLEKDVVITSESGREMKTDTLEWQRGKDLVQTKDQVTIKDESMSVKGTGLTAHPSLKDATLSSDVTANIAMNNTKDSKDNRIQITSDGPMEVDQAAQRAVFRENVIAVELVSGRQLKADMMEVHFDKDTQKISEIVCMGNVELHQGASVTNSEMLVYKANEQRVVLSGKPKLLIDAKNVDTQKVFQY